MQERNQALVRATVEPTVGQGFSPQGPVVAVLFPEVRTEQHGHPEALEVTLQQKAQTQPPV